MDFLLIPEEAERVRKVAAALSTIPMYVADAFGVSPMYVERLLSSRGQYNSGDGISITDAVRKHYGEEAADLLSN